MNPTILANAVKDTIDNEDIKGFIQPYVGIRLFKNLSPNIMINSNNINSPIGINKVNYIASKLVLHQNNLICLLLVKVLEVVCQIQA